MSQTTGDGFIPDPRYVAALAKQKAERDVIKQKAPRRRPILRIVGGTDYEDEDNSG